MIALVILIPIFAIGLGIFIASVCASRKIKEQYPLDIFINNADGEVHFSYNRAWTLFPADIDEIRPNDIICVVNRNRVVKTIELHLKHKKIEYIPDKLEECKLSFYASAFVDFQDCWWVPIYVKKHKSTYFFLMKREDVKKLSCLSDEDRLILEVL